MVFDFRLIELEFIITYAKICKIIIHTQIEVHLFISNLRIDINNLGIPEYSDRAFLKVMEILRPPPVKPWS